MLYEDKEPKKLDVVQIMGIVLPILLVVVWFKVISPSLWPPQEGSQEPVEEPGAVAEQVPAEETRRGAFEQPGETREADEQPERQAEVRQGEEEQPAAGEEEGEEPPPEPGAVPPEIVRTGEFEFVISSRGASVRGLSLLNYHADKGDEEPLPVFAPLATEGDTEPLGAFAVKLADGTDFANWNWNKVERREDERGSRLKFSASRGGWEMQREYFLPYEGSVFGVRTVLRNVSREERKARLEILTAPGLLPDEEKSRYSQIQAAFAGRPSQDGELKRRTLSASSPPDDPEEGYFSAPFNEWEALVNHYFAVAVMPVTNRGVASFYLQSLVPAPDLLEGAPERFLQPNFFLFAKSRQFSLEPGEEAEVAFDVYAGPRWEPELKKASVTEDGRNRQLESLSVYGFMKVFGPLCRLLSMILNFFYMIIPTYGIAIFLMTLTVKAALFPIQSKGMAGMQKMQALAPKISAIRKKYEHDKSTEGMRRMQLEIMEVYRQYGVSPWGGCLPMLFQLPMFIALFGTLRGAFELRQEGFLWISDLTRPDVIFNLPFEVPLLHWKTFNLIPILYLALILLQQKLQPKSGDPQQDQQRKMMSFMMIFFFVIFYNMPAGLVLYFTFNAIFSVIEQQIIKRRLAKDPVMQQIKAEVGEGTAAVQRKTSWDKQAERRKKEQEKVQERKKRRRDRPF